VDPLEPIYPDKNKLSAYSNNYTLDYPTGSPVDIHLVATNIKPTVKPKAIYNGKSISNSYWYDLISVPVLQNTGIESRTELFDNKKNPYVIRRAPFEIYEIISPMGYLKAPNSNFRAWRLSIPSNFFYKPGKYTIEISLDGGVKSRVCLFTVVIHKTRLPILNKSQFVYTNWFNLGKFEVFHALKRGSQEWYNMLDKYALLIASGRQNTIMIPHQFIYKNAQNKIILDEKLMLDFINIFKLHGIKYFEGPHLMYWNKVVATGNSIATTTGKQEMDTVITLLSKFISKHNLTSCWLQHIIDEPSKDQINNYKAISKSLKEKTPGLKIIEAVALTNELNGYIDYWVPHVNNFQHNIDFYQSQSKKGCKILVYSSLSPGGPWLNRLLDQERLREVYFGWGAAFYNTNGILHWALNEGTGDPFKQTLFKNPSKGAADNNFLPAGDSHIIYPIKTYGALSSIRFEAQRQGAEDFELLNMVNDNAKKQSLINSIFTNYKNYNKNVRNYRAVRRQLLLLTDKAY